MITILIKTFLLSFVISKFNTQSLKSLKAFRDSIIDLIPENVFKYQLQDLIIDIDTLFNCIKCQSFWIGLLLSNGNIWYACISYMIAFWYIVFISRYEVQKLN